MNRQGFLAGTAGAAASQFVGQKPAFGQASTQLQIGNSGLEAQAQAFYAEDQGLFKKNKLDVEILVQRGGAATVAASPVEHCRSGAQT